MGFTDAQLETMNGVQMSGLHFNGGDPCECGGDADTSTSKSRKYSDTMLYTHSCHDCGAEWTTWTEG